MTNALFKGNPIYDGMSSGDYKYTEILNKFLYRGCQKRSLKKGSSAKKY